MPRTIPIAAALVLLASSASAQSSDILIRIGGPADVPFGYTVGTVIVVNNDAFVHGTVDNQLIVINGTAHVTGTVRRSVTAINGKVDLDPSADVGTDVILYRSTFAGGRSQVVGRVVHEVLPSFREAAWLVWLATTLVLVAAAAGFAFLGSTQLLATTDLIRQQTGPVVLAAASVVVLLPGAALALMLTGIGMPIAVALVMFVLPAVAFLGYLIAAATIGRLLMRSMPRLSGNAYVAAITGVLVLQVVVAVPAAGLVVALLATQVGAGALAYRVWLEHRPARA